MGEISKDAIKLGKAIYLKALSGRRGFRSDQLGIPEDDDVWQEIYEAVGVNALEAAAPFIIAAERERCAKIAEYGVQRAFRDWRAPVQADAAQDMAREILEAIRSGE